MLGPKQLHWASFACSSSRPVRLHAMAVPPQQPSRRRRAPTAAAAKPDAAAAAAAAPDAHLQQGQQRTDASNDQAAYTQKLRQEAFQAGYKAGYQQGIQVQVSVSVDLDADSGSYLSTRNRQRQQRQQREQQEEQQQQAQQRSGPSGSAGSQPWLPSKRAAGGGEALSSSAASSEAAPAAAAGDSIVRSAVKGLVWRIFSTSVTVGVALVVLHDSLQVSDAIKFGGIEFAAKYVMYVLHERAWAAVALL